MEKDLRTHKKGSRKAIAILIATLVCAAFVTVGMTGATAEVIGVEISDIPAYGIVEPSGCGYFKGKVKMRFDLYMMPDAPYYNKHYVEVIDDTSPEYLIGYRGKVDKETGEPLDWKDYQKWTDSLPRIWVCNPFHSHMAYFDTSVTDEEIKQKLVKVTEYFYAFHKYCWDNDKEFINEWKKVPAQFETVREPFTAGTAGESICIARTEDVSSRAMFDTRTFAAKPETSPQDLNIGEKGTIDVGSPAIDRPNYAWLAVYVAIMPAWFYWTSVEGANPANADGTIDTVEAWFNTANSGNSVKYGTFEHLGSNELKCHDAEVYGEVSSGSKQTCTGLSIDVTAGEYIGADARAAADLSLEYHISGGTGEWTITGKYCDPNDQGTFTWTSTNIISLYGTGTGAAVGRSYGYIIG